MDQLGPPASCSLEAMSIDVRILSPISGRIHSVSSFPDQRSWMFVSSLHLIQDPTPGFIFFFFWSIFLFSISLISSVISVVRDIILFECFHHLEGIYKVPSDSPLDDLVLECHYTAN